MARANSAGSTLRDARLAYAQNLFEMFDEFDVETVRAVDIAQENDREAALHRVLDLNQLILVRSGGVSGIRDRQIARHLFLDRDARGRVRFRGRAGYERINTK